MIEKTDSNGLTKNSLNELKKYLNDVLKKSDNKFVHKMNSDVLKYFENKDIDIRYFRIIKQIIKNVGKHSRFQVLYFQIYI